MSRSQYTDDVDGWALIRWRGAVASALRERRGQELLHGIASALDAMDQKRLIAGRLIDQDGQVCALGALGLACGAAAELRTCDPEDYEQIAQFFGVAEALAREIQFVNDEMGPWSGETPEQRWHRVRWWVAEQIQSERT